MKHLTSILIAALCLLIAVPAMADRAKDLRKAIKREHKAKLKEYKKEGWKVFNSSRTLDVALLSHYEKLAELGEDAFEVVGVATKVKSKNTGAQMAYNNACINYAQMAGSTLAGRVVSDIAGDGANPEAEFEHFYAAYERAVESEIRNEMISSYSIIKENPDGTYEIQSFFIVSEDAASRARQRALERAFRESEAAQRNADQISDFVKQRLN